MISWYEKDILGLGVEWIEKNEKILEEASKASKLAAENEELEKQLIYY